MVAVLTYSLQELKLHGIKIRGGIVFSRYSVIIRFAIDLSIALW